MFLIVCIRKTASSHVYFYKRSVSQTVVLPVIYRRVRKIAKKRLIASSCLSVRPHGTTRLPLDGLCLSLTFELFF